MGDKIRVSHNNELHVLHRSPNTVRTSVVCPMKFDVNECLISKSKTFYYSMIFPNRTEGIRFIKFLKK
jgi:hypothetical protein